MLSKVVRAFRLAMHADLKIRTTSYVAILLAASLAMAAHTCDLRQPEERLAASEANTFELNDSHLHLTNFVQEGTKISDFVNIMGTTVGRAAVFGIPLQQQWDHGSTGDFAPTSYLQTDAPLY